MERGNVTQSFIQMLSNYWLDTVPKLTYLTDLRERSAISSFGGSLTQSGR